MCGRLLSRGLFTLALEPTAGSGRTPFFPSKDDLDALAEHLGLFGVSEYRAFASALGAAWMNPVFLLSAALSALDCPRALVFADKTLDVKGTDVALLEEGLAPASNLRTLCEKLRVHTAALPLPPSAYDLVSG